MSCDLDEIYGSVLSQAFLSEERGVVLSAQTLPAPPALLESDRIFIRRGMHCYNCSYRIDHLELYAPPSTLRLFALHLFSVIFHAEPVVSTLKLTQPGTDVRQWITEFKHPNPDHPPIGLSSIPTHFRYFPSQPEKHPWLDERINPHELPSIAFTNENNCVTNDEEWANRDTVYLAGLVAGTARFAELLLNAGWNENSRLEFDLECNVGFTGVAPGSSELSLQLPGSAAWPLSIGWPPHQ